MDGELYRPAEGGFTQTHTRTREHCREFQLAAVTHCELTEPTHCLYLGFFTHTEEPERGDLSRRLCGFYLSLSGFQSHHQLGSLPLMMLVCEHWFQLHLFTKPVSQTTFWCRVVRVSSAAEAGSLSVCRQSLPARVGNFSPQSLRPRWPLLRTAVVLIRQCQPYMSHTNSYIRCWVDICQCCLDERWINGSWWQSFKWPNELKSHLVSVNASL